MLVAPFAGAWIEIYYVQSYRPNRSVAPFAGAWIEIELAHSFITFSHVAPFAGAWIEMWLYATIRAVKSRSLRGSVD